MDASDITRKPSDIEVKLEAGTTMLYPANYAETHTDSSTIKSNLKAVVPLRVSSQDHNVAPTQFYTILVNPASSQAPPLLIPATQQVNAVASPTPGVTITAASNAQAQTTDLPIIPVIMSTQPSSSFNQVAVSSTGTLQHIATPTPKLTYQIATTQSGIHTGAVSASGTLNHTATPTLAKPQVAAPTLTHVAPAPSTSLLGTNIHPTASPGTPNPISTQGSGTKTASKSTKAEIHNYARTDSTHWRMCAAAYCESYVSLFSWPNAIKNPTVHAYWTSWLKADLKKFQPKKNSRLCWKHFQDDCFDNLLPYLNGFHDKLRLKDGSRPTIRFASQEEADKAAITLQGRRSEPLVARERRIVIRHSMIDNSPQAMQTKLDLEEARRVKEGLVKQDLKRKREEIARQRNLEKALPFCEQIITQIDKQTEAQIEELKRHAVNLKSAVYSMRSNIPLSDAVFKSTFADNSSHIGKPGPASSKKTKFMLKYTDSDVNHLPLIRLSSVPTLLRLIGDYDTSSKINCVAFTSDGELIIGCADGLYLYDWMFELTCSHELNYVTSVIKYTDKIYYTKIKGKVYPDMSVCVCCTDELMAEHELLLLLPGEASRYSLSVNSSGICISDNTAKTVSFYTHSGKFLWSKQLAFIPGNVCYNIDGGLLITDPDNDRLYKFSVDTTKQKLNPAWMCEGDWTKPHYISTDHTGVIYLKGPNQRPIHTVSMEGRHVSSMSNVALPMYGTALTVYKDQLVIAKPDCSVFRLLQITS